MRDDDELRPLRELPQQPHEASDVRVVERRLHLVEQVERARPREEEREEERQRAERLLAAGEERQPADALARRAQLDLDPRLLVVALGLGEAEPPLAAGEQRRGHLGEVRLHRRIRLGEAAVDRLRQLAAQLVQPGEAQLQVRGLRAQLGEMLLLAVVLLLRERVDAAECLPAALEPLERCLQLFARAVGCVLARLPEAAPRVRRLGIEPSELDLDLRNSGRGLMRLSSHVRLARGEVSQTGGQRRGERAAGLGCSL